MDAQLSGQVDESTGGSRIGLGVGPLSYKKQRQRATNCVDNSLLKLSHTVGARLVPRCEKQNPLHFLLPNLSRTAARNVSPARSMASQISEGDLPAVSRAATITVWHSLLSMKRVASSNPGSSPGGMARNPCLSAWINCPGTMRRPKTSTSPPQRIGQECARPAHKLRASALNPACPISSTSRT